MGNSGLKWMINLRNQTSKEEPKRQSENENANSFPKKQGENFDNNDKYNKTLTNFNAPSFYENDLSKYKTRNNFFKNRRTLSTSINPNFVEVSHLTTNRLGETVNTTQYNFETTLRSFNSKRNQTSLKTSRPKWNGIPSLVKTIHHNECLPPCNEKSIENIKKMDKYILRPFQVVYNKTLVGKHQIRTKKFVRDNTRKSPYFGEHISSKPYSSRYQDADTFRNHEIIKKHNNTLCLFELCLRNYGSLERKAVKRKGRDEMIKLKKSNIEKNRKEFIKMKEKNHNENIHNKL